MREHGDGGPPLEVTGLQHSYGSYHALIDVSLVVEAGEVVALVGRNGAGKSTLLRCAAGWTQATAGAIGVLGHPIWKAERVVRRYVVLVPDTPAFYDELTAWEHLRFVAQANRLPSWQQRAEDLLHRFGLWEQRDAFPQAYSRGMRYKLALCLALLVEPPLLLLDEPFGPLDPVSASQLWDELATYRDAGRAILLSSHQLPPEAAPDRYLILEAGEIIAAGTPTELRRSLGVAELSLDTLLRAALGADAAVESHA